MTNLKEVYKCEICGNIVEVLHTGQGELVCCGQPMILLKEKTEDVGLEKHVPILDESGDKKVVKVGEQPHPMDIDHFIEWVEVVLESGKSCRVFLQSGKKSEVEFVLNEKVVKIREYCNLHGLWVNNLD